MGCAHNSTGKLHAQKLYKAIFCVPVCTSAIAPCLPHYTLVGHDTVDPLGHWGAVVWYIAPQSSGLPLFHRVEPRSMVASVKRHLSSNKIPFQYISIWYQMIVKSIERQLERQLERQHTVTSVNEWRDANPLLGAQDGKGKKQIELRNCWSLWIIVESLYPEHVLGLHSFNEFKRHLPVVSLEILGAVT